LACSTEIKTPKNIGKDKESPVNQSTEKLVTSRECPRTHERKNS